MGHGSTEWVMNEGTGAYDAIAQTPPSPSPSPKQTNKNERENKCPIRVCSQDEYDLYTQFNKIKAPVAFFRNKNKFS